MTLDSLEPVTHVDDVAYVTTHFMALTERHSERPGPSYVLEDGTWYVPRDYFEQELDRDRFIRRYIAKATQLGQTDAGIEAEEAWEHFSTGIYGVCLREVTPENIALKHALVSEIESLTHEPAPENESWMSRLRNAVDSLDALEMPFSPIYDRARFDRPPTRDSHIRDVRARFFR
jgi:hypothetical protein